MTPKFRQVLYTVGVVVFAALTLLSTFRIIDPDVAASVSAALTAVLGLFGVSVAGTAAYNINKQRQQGAFDDPAPSVTDDQIKAAVEEALKQRLPQHPVQDAVSAAVKDVPVLGPLAQEILDRLK